jgi:hypothetical protein
MSRLSRCSSRSPLYAKPNRLRAEWRRSSIARCGICCAPQVVLWFGKAEAATKSDTARSRNETSRYLSAFPAVTPRTLSCVRPDFPRGSEFALAGSISPDVWNKRGRSGLLRHLRQRVHRGDVAVGSQPADHA